MKSFEMEYAGFATVDKRLSNPMIPWIVAQILRGTDKKQVSLRVEGGYLVLRECSPSGQINLKSHPLSLLSRQSLCPSPDGNGFQFLYVLRDPGNQPLLQVHLFNSKDPEEVMELVTSMKEASTRGKEIPQKSLSNASNLTTLCPDISPSSSQFFEVLYIGKIKVSHKKVPETFIDDALDKFHKLEKEKKERESLEIHMVENNEIQFLENSKSSSFGSTETIKSDLSYGDNIPKERMRKRSGSAGSVLIKRPENLSMAAAAIQDHNRTMVFQVGRKDLRLISPDRKQVLLHKLLRDITHSIQGSKHASHFAFICKELNLEQPGYIGYVFKGQSASVAEDVVTAINQAAQSECLKKQSQSASAVVSCDHCPMVWYHRLCSEIEGLGPGGAQGAITRRLEGLPQEEQAALAVKIQGALDNQASPSQKAETLMMVLRAHCEAKQARHLHDTPENRHEFLNHYLGGGTIFMKAKRSLTNSFDQLLKRKGSRDDFTPILKESSLPANATLCMDSTSSPSNEPNSLPVGIDSSSQVEGKNDSMMDIFLKVGSSPGKCQDESDGGNLNHAASWRQAIFNNVVSPSKPIKSNNIVKRDHQFYRQLWKKAINQQVLLIRMEKENAKLTARQEEANMKRIKLEYDDLMVTEENPDIWDNVISKDCDIKRYNHIISHAIKQGIPKGKRGEVWLALAEKSKSQVPQFDSTKFPNYNVPYESLLKQLTSHQHAILIDLGRTFPNHVYYSSPLGPGQLALFNILKAYSLLDPEVGYCQGLSFIAGVLLLHVTEEQAYNLLRYLMLDVGLRKSYLPDMGALQVSLYQLSRLLHDHYLSLYTHLDKFEVSPTLYAAPWILTIFASQFPLGFVARVFDVIFADSTDVLFRIALTLLSRNKEHLLVCENFEMIMDCFKNRLPNLDAISMEKIMNEAMGIDISRELADYGVEYHVLQEGLSTPRPEVKKLKQLEAQNRELTAKYKTLNEQLQIASSNIARLEASRSSHMGQMNRLESEIRGLEVTVATLGEFIQELAYSRKDLEIPSEILRILAQVSASQQQRIHQTKRLHPFRNTNRGIPLKVIDDNKPPLKFALSTPNLKVSNLFGGGRGEKVKIGGGCNGDESKGLSSGIPGDEGTGLTVYGIKKSLSDAQETIVREGGVELAKSKSSEVLNYRPEMIGRILNEDEKKVLTNRGKTNEAKNHIYDNKDKRRLLKSSQSSFELKTHPLDSEESGVEILFEGTTKLKCLNLGRAQMEKSTTPESNPLPSNINNNNNPSTPLELKIVELPLDPVGAKIKSTVDKVSRLFDESVSTEDSLRSHQPSDMELPIY